jgi:hypothetical protein
MTKYVLESLHATNYNISYHKIEDYLKNQGLVKFGGQSWYDKYYHSDKASVAVLVHPPTRDVKLHIATSEMVFIEDLIKTFPMLKSFNNSIKI